MFTVRSGTNSECIARVPFAGLSTQTIDRTSNVDDMSNENVSALDDNLPVSNEPVGLELEQSDGHAGGKPADADSSISLITELVRRYL
jgi:hypothetical protein